MVAVGAAVRRVLLQFTLVGNGEFLTAFSAARSQYFAAIGRLHALAETVYCFTTTPVRLECTFHCFVFYPVFECCPWRAGHCFKPNGRSPYPPFVKGTAKVKEKVVGSNRFEVLSPQSVYRIVIRLRFQQQGCGAATANFKYRTSNFLNMLRVYRRSKKSSGVVFKVFC